MTSHIRYTPASTEDISSPFIDDKQASSDDDESRQYTVGGRNRRQFIILHWVVHVVTFAFIIILSIRTWANEPLQSRCHKLFNYYSPMSEDLASVPFVETRFNGCLWHESPFKGPPSPAVIEAGDSIKQYGIIRATEEDLVRINRSHSLKTASKFPEIAGGGYSNAS